MESIRFLSVLDTIYVVVLRQSIRFVSETMEEKAVSGTASKGFLLTLLNVECK